MIRPPKRPRDANQLAQSIVDLVTGNAVKTTDDGKDPAAVDLGRRGGLKSGNARADRLDQEQRIARKAARTRWEKNT